MRVEGCGILIHIVLVIFKLSSFFISSKTTIILLKLKSESVMLTFYSTPSYQECKALEVQFHLLHGAAGDVLPGFISDGSLGAVVTDFSPLREPLQWIDDVKKKLPKDVPLIQVQTWWSERENDFN